MTVDAPMVNIIDFYPKQNQIEKIQSKHKGCIWFLCHQMNVLFPIHLENENPQTGSHLQVLEGESVL